MSRPRRLTDDEVQARLRDLPAWTLAHGKLERRLRFDGFPAAFAFMTRVALAAERRDHHPEWENVYDRVTVRLSTHDAGGLTDLDFALAADIDRAATTTP